MGRHLFYLLIGFVCLFEGKLQAQCYNCLSQYPTATQSTTSATFVTIDTCVKAGQYALCSVTAGQQYEWQTCGNTSFDTQITVFNDALGCIAPALVYNDDWCGLQSDVVWTATFTGLVRVLVSQYYCNTNSTCMLLQWRCNTCNLAPFCYTVASIPFNWVTQSSPTAVSLGDDQVSGALPIGFSFCYAGTSYTQFYICSNGWVGFSSGQSATWLPTAIPNSSAPKNCIMCPWLDWYPPGGGTITYQTIGTAPNRQLVVSWNNTEMYSCWSNLGTFQVVLYETSNLIDNNILNKPICTQWSGGTNATQGIQDAMGFSALSVPGRNCTQWTASNDAVEYTPTCGTCQTILPVELIDFSGEAHTTYNLLKWTTSSETNNDYFTVERASEDGQWYVLGKVSGAGTTSEEKHYTLQDPSPGSGIRYYRLMQTDFNGNFKSLGTVVLENKNLNEVNVYPNPANSMLYVDLPASAEGQISVRIYNSIGQCLYSSNSGGNEKLSLDISSYPKGIYLVEAQGGAISFRKKIVKE